MKKDLPSTTNRRQLRMERQTKMQKETNKVRCPTRTKETRGRGATTNPGIDTNYSFSLGHLKGVWSSLIILPSKISKIVRTINGMVQGYR